MDFLYFLFILVITISTIVSNNQIRKDIINCARLFDPTITKFSAARAVIRQKYIAAKKYGYKNPTLEKVIKILYEHEPETFYGYKTQNSVDKQYSRVETNEKGETLATLNLLEMPGIRDTFKDVIEGTNTYKKSIKSGEIKYPEGYTPPKFKYMQDPIKSGSLEILDEPINCFCCKKPTSVIMQPSITEKTQKKLKAKEDQIDVCLECVNSGDYYKLTNESINYKDYIISSDNKVANEEYNFQFENCTPNYNSWQDNLWLTHCNDYCTFIGQVYWQDIVKMGYSIEKQVTYDYMAQKNGLNIPIQQIKNDLTEDGPIAGYLFKCLHCDSYRLLIELA